MKTVEEFIGEIGSSEQLQNELEAITDKDALEAFFKKNDCGATAEEYVDFVKSHYEEKLSEDDAESVAGGVQPYIKDFSVLPQKRFY